MRIGADIGGTFTDVVQLSSDGTLSVQKTLSTPPAYEAGVISAIAAIVDGRASKIVEVVHGTTIATNAVLERRGALTALLTTVGFRDVLELRRLRMPRMYDLFWRKPKPLVERWLRYEVTERVLADGTVSIPLDVDQVRGLAKELQRTSVESIAVSFIHGHLYQEHEDQVARILREELPGVPVTTSSSILREEGEYERTATAVVNAYVQPLMRHYLDAILAGLREMGSDCQLTVMQSSGGLMSSADAMQKPVLALESGPAAGVIAAMSLASRLGFSNVIAFDMGGTTAKASLIEGGQVDRGWEYEAGGELSSGSRLIRGSGELLRIPNIDIAEVGAGGGSIAWLDAAGGLQVGPKSAGASPGPACYGLGGTACTVTDANVTLGYIPEGGIADSAIQINRSTAVTSVESIADLIGMPPLVTARGIHDLANARMMRALRSVSSERGRDPRHHALLAYGGSGPVHAASLADELGIRTVLVPVHAGLFSALGLLFARPEYHEVLACQILTDTTSAEFLHAQYLSLQERIIRSHPQARIIEWRRSADLRYEGQSWQIEVPVEIAEPDLNVLRESFEAEHKRLYGVTPNDNLSIEIRALRLVALGDERSSQDGVFTLGHREEDLNEMSTAYFDGQHLATRLVDRQHIGTEPEVGPILVREYDTTVVVPPSWSVRRDRDTHTLVLEKLESTE